MVVKCFVGQSYGLKIIGSRPGVLILDLHDYIYKYIVPVLTPQSVFQSVAVVIAMVSWET